MKLKQISFLSFFATVLVVIGHSDITLDYKDLWLYKWVYSFHMPLFFFISGFLFAYTNPESKIGGGFKISTFLYKKVRRLLYPYILFNSVIFILKSLLVDDSVMQHPVVFSFGSYLDCMFMHPIGFLWFLPALFVIFIIFSIGIKFIYKKWYVPSLIIALFVLNQTGMHINFFQISSALNYAVYFGLGILYCQYKTNIDTILFKYRYLFFIICFYLSAMLINVKIVAAIIGILFSLSLSIIVDKYYGASIIKLSNYTYTVFLLSYFPQMFIRGPIAHAYPDVNQYVLSVLSFTFGLGIPLLIGCIYDRYLQQYNCIRRIAFLIGL